MDCELFIIRSGMHWTLTVFVKFTEKNRRLLWVVVRRSAVLLILNRDLARTPLKLRFSFYFSHGLPHSRLGYNWNTIRQSKKNDHNFNKMDFNALLQEAQKLNNETNTSDSLPRVERSLPQVLQATRELHSRVTQTEAQDIQAYVSSICAIHDYFL